MQERASDREWIPGSEYRGCSSSNVRNAGCGDTLDSDVPPRGQFVPATNGARLDDCVVRECTKWIFVAGSQ